MHYQTRGDKKANNYIVFSRASDVKTESIQQLAMCPMYTLNRRKLLRAFIFTISISLDRATRN